MEENIAGARFRKNIEDFTCLHCGYMVKGNGYTDHCPRCLWGRHVDNMPGDRASECRGTLKPMYATHDRKGYTIVYRCMKCKAKKQVSAAEDDDPETLLTLLEAR